MDRDQSLRAHLRRLLDWEDAHAGFDTAVEGVPAQLQGKIPEGHAHSLWQLLEHLRLAQRDILDFCRNPDYEEPASMEEHWPRNAAPPTPESWRESIATFKRDLQGLRELAEDAGIDLFDRIPHGSGQTYLRELLLAADHNSYHVGQLILVRRALGIWPRQP